MNQAETDNEAWLTLSQAAGRLQVHPTTLRRWADNGDIPCLLTPGGHRRFAAREVNQFAANRHGRRDIVAIEQVWADQALAHTRAEVINRGDQSWLVEMNEEARLENRIMGQQLMGLTLQFLSDDGGDETILGEARQLGRQYGRLALSTGLPLTDALKAAMFFRDTLVETALQMPENVRVRTDANMRLLRRINVLLNAVHLAIAEVYDAD